MSEYATLHPPHDVSVEDLGAAIDARLKDAIGWMETLRVRHYRATLDGATHSFHIGIGEGNTPYVMMPEAPAAIDFLLALREDLGGSISSDSGDNDHPYAVGHLQDGICYLTRQACLSGYLDNPHDWSGLLRFLSDSDLWHRDAESLIRTVEETAE